jgi:hypothetical protein
MTHLGLITWAFLGVLGLILQATLLFKDHLATYQPLLRPALVQLCAWADCQIAPLQLPDAVVIDHAAIDQRPSNDEDVFSIQHWTISIHLRNSAVVPVAMPWVELTLTDAQDQAVMRKVIDLKQLDAPIVMAPGEIVSLTHQLSLQNPDINFVGYRLLTFYP